MQRTLSIISGIVRTGASSTSQTTELFMFLRAGSPMLLPTQQSHVRFAKNEVKKGGAAAPAPKKQAKISKTGKSGVEKKDEFEDNDDEVLAAKSALDATNLTKVEDLTEEELKKSFQMVTGLRQARYTPLQSNWTPASKRTGVVARKLGMLRLQDDWGKYWPLTALHLENNVVTQVKTVETDGYTALQIACSDIQPRKTTKAMIKHFEKAGVTPKRKLFEFHVTPDALLKPGQSITARHFIPNQYVDVTGISKGHGFAGAMERHHFGGLRATHGVSVSHRSHGATGQRQDPGRVFKGKKMAGHMGVDQRTVQSLRVFHIYPLLNVVLVCGSVPGPNKGYVRVKDAIRRPFKVPPPFPTFVPAPTETEDTTPQVLVGDSGSDPFASLFEDE